MNPAEYKTFHEDYMKHNTGTSFEECVELCLALPFIVFISSWISSHTSKRFFFAVQTVSIIFLIMSVTLIFPDVNHIIFLNLVVLSLLILITKVNIIKIQNLLNSKIPKKKDFITNYRAGTIFTSTFCILAVDFIIFPKRLAKTESFGFGFMDLGVGFFVCSNGLVEKHSLSKTSFLKVLKKTAVLFILGLIRVISVKSTDYHEHVSEYGVHWNFFFTLSTCYILSYITLVLTNNLNPLLLSLGIGICHQCLLYFGLEEWVLSDTSRSSSFLSANREGIVSCLGYVSLYFAASSVGKLIFSDLTYNNLLKKLVIVCVFMWVGVLVVTEICGISRRLVNLGYICWISALSTTFLILFILEELCTFGLSMKHTLRSLPSVPVLFECVNANGLLFFLFANLLTGLINTCFQTLLLGKLTSLIIISSYLFILICVIYFMFVKNIFFKF